MKNKHGDSRDDEIKAIYTEVLELKKELCDEKSDPIAA